MSYILVLESENDDPVELPCEKDGTLLLSTLQGQLPTATGLKYKNPETGAYRAIRLADGHLDPPTDDGWGHIKYVAVFPKPLADTKRKTDEEANAPASKTKRLDIKSQCTDLIVLGVPWKVNEKTLREYFEKFGQVAMCELKCDRTTGKSKGFGFVRFTLPETQLRVLAQRHVIEGESRWFEVLVPDSRDGQVLCDMPTKIFVGRINEDMTVEDIKEYFSKFSEVTEVNIPKPFHNLCFVTFLEPNVLEKLWGQVHIIKGVTVHVSEFNPKIGSQNSTRNRKGKYDGSDRGYSGNRNDDNWKGNSNMGNIAPLPQAVVAAALSQLMSGSLSGNNDGGFNSPQSSYNNGRDNYNGGGNWNNKPQFDNRSPLNDVYDAPSSRFGFGGNKSWRK